MAKHIGEHRLCHVEPARYSDIKPSRKRLPPFLTPNKENYKTDPMVKARYVVFDPDGYKTEVTVDDRTKSWITMIPTSPNLKPRKR
jgi:hypothetical protein